jgi:hypothetical protein
MSPDRRLIALLGAALAVAAPAIVLVALCVGRACERAAPIAARVPFCSLPPEVRGLLEAGFRDGRSPHVMAVTGSGTITGSSEVPDAPWPSGDRPTGGRVPLVFAVRSPQGAEARFLPDVPDGTRLDAVAPTISDIIGLDRPHPGVRSGQALPTTGQPDGSGERPRLVLLVVWKGIGGQDVKLARLPNLRSVFMAGTGTGEARVGSLPLDPAAVMATIGTGGLPRDHGMTGTAVRNDRGRVVRAFGPGSPFSVIAALGDDLDELNGQRPRVGVVGTDVSDRALIGRNWYLEHDQDDVVVESRTAAQLAAADRLLASGYGDDAFPDLLAVAMEGSPTNLDQALGRLLASAGEATSGSTLVVVTATGSASSDDPGSIPVASVERDVERAVGADVIEATAVGGFFLDQEALTSSKLTDDRVVDALRDIEGPGGAPLFADVFPQVAVTFAKYC